MLGAQPGPCAQRTGPTAGAWPGCPPEPISYLQTLTCPWPLVPGHLTARQLSQVTAGHGHAGVWGEAAWPTACPGPSPWFWVDSHAETGRGTDESAEAPCLACLAAACTSLLRSVRLRGHIWAPCVPGTPCPCHSQLMGSRCSGGSLEPTHLTASRAGKTPRTTLSQPLPKPLPA